MVCRGVTADLSPSALFLRDTFLSITMLSRQFGAPDQKVTTLVDGDPQPPRLVDFCRRKKDELRDRVVGFTASRNVTVSRQTVRVRGALNE